MKKIFLSGIAALFLARPTNAEPIDPADIYVIDGDSIQILTNVLTSAWSD